jgi:hypothetical protein
VKMNSETLVTNIPYACAATHSMKYFKKSVLLSNLLNE